MRLNPRPVRTSHSLGDHGLLHGDHDRPGDRGEHPQRGDPRGSRRECEARCEKRARYGSHDEHSATAQPYDQAMQIGREECSSPRRPGEHVRDLDDLEVEPALQVQYQRADGGLAVIVATTTMRIGRSPTPTPRSPCSDKLDSSAPAGPAALARKRWRRSLSRSQTARRQHTAVPANTQRYPATDGKASRGNQNQPASVSSAATSFREDARVLWEPFADNCPDRHP